MNRPARIAADDPRLKAFIAGQPTADTEAQIAEKRAGIARLREERAIRERSGERRHGERRTEVFDRRDGDRRFATMGDKLDAAAAKQADKRYAAEPAEPSAFMDSLK